MHVDDAFHSRKLEHAPVCSALTPYGPEVVSSIAEAPSQVSIGVIVSGVK